MPIAQSRVPHVRQFNCTLRTRIHEVVAMEGMKLRGRDDFCELFHVDRFDVNNVYAAES